MDSSLDAHEYAGPSGSRPTKGLTGQDEGAPRYSIPQRHLSAVEIPAVVENVDRTIKAFGRNATLAHVSFHSFSCVNKGWSGLVLGMKDEANRLINESENSCV